MYFGYSGHHLHVLLAAARCVPVHRSPGHGTILARVPAVGLRHTATWWQLCANDGNVFGIPELQVPTGWGCKGLHERPGLGLQAFATATVMLSSLPSLGWQAAPLPARLP